MKRSIYSYICAKSLHLNGGTLKPQLDVPNLIIESYEKRVMLTHTSNHVV